jgi:hypothetical protein
LLSSCYFYNKTKYHKKYSIHILEAHKSVPRDIEPQKKGQKNKEIHCLNPAIFMAKQRYSVHMPEAHRYLPRDIEAKAKGGSNFSF